MGAIPPGESIPRWTWTFAYQDGKLASITDPAGWDTTFTVDGNNQLTTIAGPDGSSRQYTYDEKNLLTSVTDENGAITSHDYDEYGRLTSVTEPPRLIYDPVTGQAEMRQESRTFTPSDTAYPLINDSPVGDPDNPAPAVPMSDDLVDGVVYGQGWRQGQTNEWGGC